MSANESPPLTGNGPWACIDQSSIGHNLTWLRRRLAPNLKPYAPTPKIWAVVKADAYGHGLAHAIEALAQADGISVAELNDALHVRKLGWTRPILLLSQAGVSVNALRDPTLGELHIAVDDAAVLEHLESAPTPLSQVHAWLRYAGQLRSHGFDSAEYAPAFHRLQSLVHRGILTAAGHLHHYAASEDPAALDLERRGFAAVTEGLPGPHCTGNSAALCGDAAVPIHHAGQWLRCGLLLYGASALPGRTGAELGLRPAMSLRARLLAVRRVAAGQSVGYGESFRAARDTCIGVVGIGYGHGLPRDLWRHGHLLAGHGGRPVPLAGRVAMDCLTVDLGPQPVERPGDIMTVWGRAPGGAALAVEAAAQACGTIAAELLTGLTRRVPVIALKEG